MPVGTRCGWRVRGAWLGAGLLLTGAGCFGERSGPGEALPEDLYSLPLGVDTICWEGVRTEVGLDSATDLGFSAASILEFAEGKKTQRRVVPGDPEADDGTQLVVEVEALDDPAQAFDPESGIVGHGLRCDPWLELAVRVSVKTSDGSLDARFDATLFAVHPDVAILYARPDGKDLRLLLSPYGVSAQLWEDDTPAFADGEPSRRYAAPECTRDRDNDFSVPLDAQHYGLTAQGLVDRMNALALDVLWDDDGTRTAATASFQRQAEHGCLLVNQWVPETTLRVEAQLDLATDDGRFAGVMPGSIWIASDPAGSPFNQLFSMDPEAFAASEPVGMGFPEYADRRDLDLEVRCSIQLDAADQISLSDLALLARGEEVCDSTGTCVADRTLELGTLVNR